jgi:predicted DNA-binding transcriptional regulator AlpA
MTSETLTTPAATPDLAGGPRPLLVGRIDAARLCGTSPRTWDRLASSGRTPRPVRLGGRPLWRLAELAEWISAGCPDRDTWDAITAADSRGKK